MIPSNVDIDSIVASLSDAAIYVDPKFPQANKISQRELEGVIDDAENGEAKEKFGKLKVALIEQSLSGTGMRDVAQRIKDESNANTVIVRSPGGTAAVADGFSRYNLESNSHLASKGSAATGLQTYIQALDHHRTPEATVNIGGLIALVLSIAITAIAARTLTSIGQA